MVTWLAVNVLARIGLLNWTWKEDAAVLTAPTRLRLITVGGVMSTKWIKTLATVAALSASGMTPAVSVCTIK